MMYDWSAGQKLETATLFSGRMNLPTQETSEGARLGEYISS